MASHHHDPHCSIEHQAGKPVAGIKQQTTEKLAGLATYWPLLVVVGLSVTLPGLRGDVLDGITWMARSMGYFFVWLAFVKLIEPNGFAQGFAQYDFIARRWFPYGYLYPWCELALGYAYLTPTQPSGLHLLTLVWMVVGGLGVLSSLLAGEQLKCACMGALIPLPLGTVSLMENGVMAGMALMQWLAAG